jgi:hypothetical protein
MTAALAGLGAGLVDVGIHYYSLTYYTALGETRINTFAATAPSATTTALDGQVQLASIPISADARTIGRRIYRTKAGASSGAEKYLVASIANNTDTTYLDNVADAALGVGLAPTSHRSPNRPRERALPWWQSQPSTAPA